MRWIDMHDKPVNKIENKTEEREEDTEKFYVAEEGVPLYICDQNALIAYYGSEIELNRTIVSPRGDGIYSARLPLLDVALPFLVYGRGLLFLDAYYLMSKSNIPALYGMASAFLKHALISYESLQQFMIDQIDGLMLSKAFLSIKAS